MNERRLLATGLNEQAKWSIEKLQPSVFVVSNEEEIAKNILVLNREISTVADLPLLIVKSHAGSLWEYRNGGHKRASKLEELIPLILHCPLVECYSVLKRNYAN